MKFEKYDIIDGGKWYEIKLYNIEDYMYNGEMSKSHQFDLPYYFDINNESHIEKVLDNLKDIIEENNYDTFSITENVAEEHLYTIE